VVQACSGIRKLKEKVIKWLYEEESKIISARIKQAHGFVNFLALIDGILLLWHLHPL